MGYPIKYLPFQGDPGANQLVYAGSVTSRIQINQDSKVIRLVNQGLYVCYVRIGNSSVEATTSDLPVLSGESIVVEKDRESTHIAFISASGTVLNIQTGMSINNQIYTTSGYEALKYDPHVWFDASDTSTITENLGKVSQLDDKSGNDRNATQGTSANQVTTGSETQNGLNVLSADGNDKMTFPCSINPLNPIYVFQVTKFTSVTDIIEDFTGTSVRLVVANNVIGRDSGSGIVVKNVTSTTLNTAIVCSSFHINDDSNEFTKREDGTQIYNDTVGTDFTTGTFTTGYLFDDSTGGNAISGGWVGEYIVYNPSSEFTSDQITEIENYLVDKWGIS